MAHSKAKPKRVRPIEVGIEENRYHVVSDTVRELIALKPFPRLKLNTGGR